MPSSLLRTAYRGLLRPSARRAIRRIVAEGAPAALATPLSYLAWPTTDPADRQVLAPIERFREKLAAQPEPASGLTVFDSPAPRRPDEPRLPGPVNTPSFKRLITETSVNPYWGTFLYLCAKQMRASTVLELGGCIGMSASYLSAGDPIRHVISVEGAPGLVAIGEANVRTINPNARLVNAMFDDALDEWLPQLSGKLDLAHIDGQHERFSTLHYFNRIKPHLRPGALVIFDDIHWSDDMRQAWGDLSRSRGVSDAIDVGRYGLCIWQGSDCVPRIHDFSRYASDWRDENQR